VNINISAPNCPFRQALKYRVDIFQQTTPVISITHLYCIGDIGQEITVSELWPQTGNSNVLEIGLSDQKVLSAVQYVAIDSVSRYHSQGL
jgi:hypothetical protein